MALLLVAVLAFVSLGLPDTVLGVAWPSVRREFHLPLSALGVLLAAAMSGYLASSFSSGPVVTRLGVGRVLLWSSALTAASALGYAVAPAWPVMVLCACLGGLGAGAIDAGINAHAALHFSPRAVTVLHAAYGVGATAGPALMTLFLTHGAGWRAGYAAIAAILAALAGGFALTLPLWPRPGPIARSGATAPPAPRFGAVLRRPVVVLHASLFAVYAGIEATAGQWLYSLLTEARELTPATAGAWTSLYWASLTAGRILVGLTAPRLAPVALLRVAMLGALGGAALIAVAGSPGVGLAGVIALGLAAGPIYPLLIAETPGRLGAAATAHAVGLQVAAAYLGAAAWPALAGVIARSAGLEVVGPLIVVLGAVLLALHEAALRRGRGSAQVAGGESPRLDLAPVGLDGGAPVHGLRAARVKPTPGRRVRRARDLALQHDALAARRRMKGKRRRQ
jgi:fucose permease